MRRTDGHTYEGVAPRAAVLQITALLGRFINRKHILRTKDSFHGWAYN